MTDDHLTEAAEEEREWRRDASAWAATIRTPGWLAAANRILALLDRLEAERARVAEREATRHHWWQQAQGRANAAEAERYKRIKVEDRAVKVEREQIAAHEQALLRIAELERERSAAFGVAEDGVRAERLAESKLESAEREIRTLRMVIEKQSATPAFQQRDRYRFAWLSAKRRARRIDRRHR